MPPASTRSLYQREKARRRRRNLAVAISALALFAVASAVIVLAQAVRGDDAKSAAKEFVHRWSSGSDSGAAALTDNPHSAVRALAANRRGLDGASLQAELGAFHNHGDSADAVIRLRWNVPKIGIWQYDTRARLVRQRDHWLIHWAPSLVHPKLDDGTTLGTVHDESPRGEILDRSGAALVVNRAVVEVGLARDAVADVAGSSRQLAAALGIDANPLERAVRGAGPQQFVQAITLRVGDYEQLAPQLKSIKGLEVIPTHRPLAPTRDFGRAILGAVGPPTAEQVKQLGSSYDGTSEIGQWGLEAAFNRRLSGTATSSVVIRSKGVPLETLLQHKGRAGTPLRTTLDYHFQAAAEAALGSTRAPSALVAVQPSTGDILAVANRPTDSTYDRALAGQYPPGSTFKVVTASALMQHGVSPSSSVPCPKTLTVDGKLFKNFEGEAGGPVTFAEDFAKSCNTAFVSLAPRLPFDGLTREAKLFGIGQPVHLPVPAAKSRVPAPRNEVERAAAMIGQERIVASPLALAGVAAAVADGRWRAPRLLASDPHHSGDPIPADRLSALRSMMRAVVTSGTGTALASAPGAVSGKTGTAEYGGGDPPPTHAWFIAFRGDVAIAVLVEEGSSGGVVAAPIAARFFDHLGPSQ